MVLCRLNQNSGRVYTYHKGLTCKKSTVLEETLKKSYILHSSRKWIWPIHDLALHRFFNVEEFDDHSRRKFGKSTTYMTQARQEFRVAQPIYIYTTWKVAGPAAQLPLVLVCHWPPYKSPPCGSGDHHLPSLRCNQWRAATLQLLPWHATRISSPWWFESRFENETLLEEIQNTRIA